MRILCDERLELTSQLPVASRIQSLFDSLLQTREALVLQARNLRLRETVVGKVTDRRSAPECECFVELSCALQVAEAGEVEFVVGDSEYVAGGFGFQPVFAQEFAEAGDVHLQCFLCACGWIGLPE